MTIIRLFTLLIFLKNPFCSKSIYTPVNFEKLVFQNIPSTQIVEFVDGFITRMTVKNDRDFKAYVGSMTHGVGNEMN